jgi:DNA-binding NarL/FixJ family response regulator
VAQRAPRPSALVVVAEPRVRADVAGRLRALGISEVAEAGTVSEARRLAGALPLGLVVLDVALPDGPGLRLLAELRHRGLSRAVVLSSREDPHTVRAALAAGVKGYLATRPRVRTLAAVHGTGFAPRSRTGPDALSAREVEVLRLVADGQSNREVGTTLGLSALTVKSHLARIGRKLGSGDRAEMVALSLRSGIIT